MTRTEALALAAAAKQAKAAERRAAVLRQHELGRRPQYIAQVVGVSVWSVRRYLREARQTA